MCNYRIIVNILSRYVVEKQFAKYVMRSPDFVSLIIVRRASRLKLLIQLPLLRGIRVY